MLSHYLQNTLSDLRDIINITKSDIKDIKKAEHTTQFDRLALKEEKLKSFETKKAIIDHEISSLMTKNPGVDLPDLLNEEQHILLEELKVELNNLREVNKQYAKFVLLVSNLYNTFLERLVPTEMEGYDKVTAKSASILEVRV
ncbi:MAG: hypothetical protein DSZ04_03125 [Sulfurimonas sp.]|nr:MAG: hypothetical protein DSZ04_03125 [Sulfurimonas sp.]